MAAWNLAHPMATITDTENQAPRTPTRCMRDSVWPTLPQFFTV